MYCPVVVKTMKNIIKQTKMPYNKSFKFAPKQRGLDAAQKTRTVP
jgi:hypothetical protein